jgi:prepilin-type N-terminal cleavage/methylation domain-containing protein
VAHKSGFTIVEVIATMAIFALFLVSSLGATLAIVGVNNKTQTLKLAINNLNFNVEKMSRDIRSGRSYFCGVPVTYFDPVSGVDFKDCTVESGANSAKVTPSNNNGFAFLSKTGETVVYRLEPVSVGSPQGYLRVGIFSAANPGAYPGGPANYQNYQPFTSDQIRFNSIYFYVQGADPCTDADGAVPCGADRDQATVVIVMKGTAGVANTQSSFSIQTSVERRSIDTR